MSSLTVAPPDTVGTPLMHLSDMAARAGDTAVDVALAVAVILVGWGVAVLVSRVVRAALRAASFNQAVRRIRGAESSAGHEPARLVSWAVYWLIIAVAIVLALETLGVRIGSSVGARLSEVLPRIVTSALLFAAGGLVALALGGLTRRFFETAGWSAARLRGQIVTGVLTIFAGLLALEQLGFAAQFVMALGVVAIGAIGLALGLAFGLGCRDLARDFIVEYLRSLDEGGPKRPS